jgi:hypothetical protein
LGTRGFEVTNPEKSEEEEGAKPLAKRHSIEIGIAGATTLFAGNSPTVRKARFRKKAQGKAHV